MPPFRPLFPILLVAFVSSCVPRHYSAEEIVDLPTPDRDVLFAMTSASTLARTEAVAKYEHKKIKWHGFVSDIGKHGTIFFPLSMVVVVRNPQDGYATTCLAFFQANCHDQLQLLRERDEVTIVGWLAWLAYGRLGFGDCELIRAERDGKQIYPPPEADKKP